MKASLASSIKRFHVRIFGHEMSVHVADFLKKLSWVTFGLVLAKLFILLMQVIGGRVLGEQVYGEFNLIVSVASLLAVPFFIANMGSGVVKYVAGFSEKKKIKAYLSTAFVTFIKGLFACTAIYVLVPFLFPGLLSVLDISGQYFWLAIVGAILWGVQTYVESVLRALHKMKSLALLHLFSTAISFILFLVLLVHYTSPLVLFIPFFGAYFLYALVGFFQTKEYLSLQHDKQAFSKLWIYTKYGFFVTIALGLSGNVDKIMLNSYLGAASVGLYHAYYTSSTVIMSALVMMFVMVFFPTVNKFSEKKGIFSKLKKSFVFIIPLLLVILPIQTIIFVKYFYNYGLFFFPVVGFVLSTIFIIVSSLCGTLMMSINKKTLKQYSWVMVCTSLLNVLLNFILIRVFDLTGALIATTISTALQAALLYYYLQKNFKK